MSQKNVVILLIALSFLAIFALAWALLQSGQRAEAEFHRQIETRVLEVLKREGMSGLAVALDSIDTGLLPTSDRVEIALWRVVGSERTLVRETLAGVADRMSAGSRALDLDGETFVVRFVDVRTASENWPFPVVDVEVAYAMVTPTREGVLARQTVGLMLAAYGLGLGLVGLAYLGYLRRYRRSVTQIYKTLDRFSAGQTHLRIASDLPAQELRDLAKELNVVLPRLDQIYQDLRAFGGHLAHELRTPLQTILNDVHALFKAKDPALRAQTLGRIEARIDDTAGRVEGLLQLFRLQSDATVPFEPEVPFGALFAELAYDSDVLWSAQGGVFLCDIDETVIVDGNPHLVRILVANVLDNARKYAPPHSTIEAHLSQTDGRFRLLLENEGTLPEGFGDFAFDRYVQAAAETGRLGVGLGLSLVQSIAERHGFDVTIDTVAPPESQPRVRLTIEGATWIPNEAGHV